MIAVTDPDGVRHENVAWFFLPTDLPGITINPMDLLISGGEGGTGSGVKNTVYFDNVRVPGFNLIGGENEGWKVGQTHLELEHGTGGRVGRDRMVDRLFHHCKSAYRNGRPLTEDPDARDLLVDIYIEAEIGRLFGLRNYWLRHSGQKVSYEGPQLSLQRKMSGLRMGRAILEILGPAALTTDPQWALVDGHIEAHQRSSIVAVHPGGTADIQKVIMARRIGIGRATREQAAALA
jgi:alkylation response protein AidB-like acyl-CoA dehydrogenase